MTDVPLALEPGPRQAPPRTLFVATSLVVLAIVAAFGVLIGVYAMLRHDAGGTTAAWVPSGVLFRNAQIVFTLLTLAVGSIAVQWAVHANDQRVRTDVRVALLVTAIFGVLHLNMVLYVVGSFGAGVGDLWGNLVYTLTGAAIALSVAAIAYVVVMAVKAFGGQLGPANPGIGPAAVFWHAHALVWVAVFFTVFVVK